MTSKKQINLCAGNFHIPPSLSALRNHPVSISVGLPNLEMLHKWSNTMCLFASLHSLSKCFIHVRACISLHFYLWLNNASLHRYTVFYSFNYQLTDIWVLYILTCISNMTMDIYIWGFWSNTLKINVEYHHLSWDETVLYGSDLCFPDNSW